MTKQHVGGGVYLIFVGILIWGDSRAQSIEPLRTATAALLGGLTIWFLLSFIEQMGYSTEDMRIESHWGGLGGGVGGWGFPRPLVYLFGVLATAGMLFLLLPDVRKVKDPSKQESKQEAGNKGGQTAPTEGQTPAAGDGAKGKLTEPATEPKGTTAATGSPAATGAKGGTATSGATGSTAATGPQGAKSENNDVKSGEKAAK